MPITFDRRVCRDLNETISREWLVTNGIGGSAAGTVAGVLTRMQHGLLVTSPFETAAPQLLVAKIDEEVVFDQRTYYLGTNEYLDGTLNPAGFVHLETFRLEEGFPVFTYRIGGIDGIMLEKRVWMVHGYNTTYIQYRVLRAAEALGPAYENVWSASNRVSAGRTTGNTPTMHRAPSINRGATVRYHGYPEDEQRTLTLTLLPFSAYRAHAQPQYGNNEWHFQVHTLRTEDGVQEDEQEEARLPKGTAGCTIRAWDGAHPYHILAVGHAESQAAFIPTGVWYWQFLRRHDQAAGLPPTDDLYLPGVFRAKLWPDEDATLTIIASAEELSEQFLSPRKLNLSYTRSIELQRNILCPQRYFGEGGETAQRLPVLAVQDDHEFGGEQDRHEELLRLLLQAGNHFLARRSLPSRTPGNDSLFSEALGSIPFVPAGYFGMEEYTRDTLMALPGLMLVPGRYDEARRLLWGLARFFKQGLLPDRLPQDMTNQVPTENDYSNVDTTLWYFYALDYYIRFTRDYELLDELYMRLAEYITWYTEGTLNGIRVDAHDGLLQARQSGKALTWMNVVTNNVPVTPREGKPVEVNALWYHALSLMHEWSQLLYSMGRINHTTSSFEEQRITCRQSFQQRFWHADRGYLYDVIDGPGDDDTSLRPNQLFAVSLRYPLLCEEHQHAVLDTVTSHLLTPLGLRTLAPGEPAYQGQLQENLEEMQRVLHQGSIWPWLIGPYADAWLRLHSSTSTRKEIKDIQRKGPALLEPFHKQLSRDLLGMIGSTFAGELPHRSGYHIGSALSIGELLRVYHLFTQLDRVQMSRISSKLTPIP